VQGNSFVSGTAYFNNIVVYGTSSVQYITSSQVNVGTNIITVNTDTPAVRFGGLAVFDSGSTQLTGSILWDSEKNHWVYSNPSGSTYSGGMLISGPRSSALGSEQGTTSCMLLVGQGGDHLTSSLVYHSSTVTCIPNILNVGGALSGTSATFGGLATINVPTDNTTVGIFHAGGGTANRGLKISTFACINDNAGVRLDAQTTVGGATLILATAGVDRLMISSCGNVGMGTLSPCTLLHAIIPTCWAVNGPVANSYPVATFSQCDCAGGARGLQIGVPTGGVSSPVFLKVNNTGARFSILDSSNCENFTISGGVVGIGVSPAAQSGGTYAGSTEVGGIIRVQGTGGRYFTSGDGLEISKIGIYSYNRGASAYNDITINDAFTVKGGGVTCFAYAVCAPKYGIEGYNAAKTYFFSGHFESATYNVATITGENAYTVAAAHIDWVSNYSLAATNMSVGKNVVSTRRGNSNSMWVNCSCTILNYGDSFAPTFGWSNGVLQVTAPGSTGVNILFKVIMYAGTLTINI
jgi:hypothetical protein